jgi:hypothetical protein
MPQRVSNSKRIDGDFVVSFFVYFKLVLVQHRMLKLEVKPSHAPSQAGVWSPLIKCFEFVFQLQIVILRVSTLELIYHEANIGAAGGVHKQV